MGDIFVTPFHACQAPWWPLTTPGQVSRGAASSTGVFPVGVAAAPGHVAVPFSMVKKLSSLKCSQQIEFIVQLNKHKENSNIKSFKNKEYNDPWIVNCSDVQIPEKVNDVLRLGIVYYMPRRTMRVIA